MMLLTDLVLRSSVILAIGLVVNSAPRPGDRLRLRHFVLAIRN